MIGYERRKQCAGCGGRQFDTILGLGIVPCEIRYECFKCVNLKLNSIVNGDSSKTGAWSD